MVRIIIGIFFILHGFVYLLFFGQSQRLFELRPGMVWPDDSWLFSRFLGEQATRWLASITFILAAIAFVAGGIGLILGQAWWRPIVVGAAIFSSAISVLFWDGRRQRLGAQGGIGLLINLAILAVLLILQWTSLG
ncbi:MAG: hypothetical protein WBD62_08455 [Anaerolineales bacterium]